MVSVMKISGNIDSWENVRFSVEIKENDQGGGYESSTRIYSSGRLK